MGFAAGDANVRRYVGNDPVNKVAPTGLDEVVLGTDGVYFKLTRSALSPRYWWSGDRVYRLGDYVIQDGEQYVRRGANYVPYREVQANRASTWGNMVESSWGARFADPAVDFAKNRFELRWRDAGPDKLRDVFIEEYGSVSKHGRSGKELLAKMDAAGVGIRKGVFGPGYGAWRFKSNNDIEIDTDYNLFPFRGDRSPHDAAKELWNALTDPGVAATIDQLRHSPKTIVSVRRSAR